MQNSTEAKTKKPAQQSAELPSIVSKKEAISKGLKRYFTGKPCKYGHIKHRNVKGSDCVLCLKIRCDSYYKNNRSELIMSDKKIERIYEAFQSLNDRVSELTPETPISEIETEYVELYDAITDNKAS